MTHTIQNQYLRATIDEMGAELVSLQRLSDGREYLWHGDARWWHGHCPILFPATGGLWNGTYRHNGQTYTNVLRTYLGDPLGNLVTPVGDTFSQQFSGTLPLGLDPEKMRLVAVIHKAHTEEAPTLTLDNARDYDIINCTDARLTGEGGVTDVTIDAADKQIEAIYTLQGTRVATDAPLAPGLYIIRYTDSTTAKRLIR